LGKLLIIGRTATIEVLTELILLTNRKPLECPLQIEELGVSLRSIGQRRRQLLQEPLVILAEQEDHTFSSADLLTLRLEPGQEI